MQSADLKKVFLFQDLNDSEITELFKLCKELTCNPGHAIFEKGSKAEAFYLIKHGSIKITIPSQSGEDLGIKTLGTGSHFGEMSFIDQGERSATAHAIEPSALLEIPYKPLQQLMSSNTNMGMKIYKAFATYLSQRLRATTEDLGSLRELKLRH